MKISQRKLKRIIREEISSALKEGGFGEFFGGKPQWLGKDLKPLGSTAKAGHKEDVGPARVVVSGAQLVKAGIWNKSRCPKCAYGMTKGGELFMWGMVGDGKDPKGPRMMNSKTRKGRQIKAALAAYANKSAKTQTNHPSMALKEQGKFFGQGLPDVSADVAPETLSDKCKESCLVQAAGTTGTAGVKKCYRDCMKQGTRKG